jgi:hypothetical protein
MRGLLADFQTGAILSWAIPLGVLFAVWLWWLMSFRGGRSRR